jgi:hypothetical protein
MRNVTSRRAPPAPATGMYAHKQRTGHTRSKPGAEQALPSTSGTAPIPGGDKSRRQVGTDVDQ